MKKGLKITGIVLAVILILLISIPFLFSGKIESIIKKQANDMLNAELDFKSLNISLIRNFPQASISLKDFYIKGEEEFANDTLIQGKELTATVNLFSLFGSSGYVINKVILDQSKLTAKVLKSGKANWDIMKESDNNEATEEVSTDEDDFALKIQKVQIKKFDLIYDDLEGKQYARIDNLNLTLSGDLSSKATKLDIETQLANLLYSSEGNTLLNNVAITAKVNLDADFVSNKYTLNKNQIQLNAIKTSLDGWVQLKDDDAIDMDLKLNTDKINFRDILSLIPVIYMDDDFKKIKTDGEVDLSAFAKGTFKGEQLPAFDLTLNVNNATVKYPGVPASIDKINIHANVNNPGGNADLTQIKVDPCHLTIGGNPISLTALVSNPVTDPKFNIALKGILDFAKVAQVYPMDDIKLKGVIDANMALSGRMSHIEKELYDKLSASGNLKLSNLEVAMKDMPNIEIKKSAMSFTSQSVKLDDTAILIGKSDVTINSQLSNYLGYIMKGSTISGSLNVVSNHFNANELLGEDVDTQANGEDDSPMSLIEIPKNVNFNMNANFKEILYDDLKLTNLKGNIIIKNGRADMSNLSFNTFEGGVKMNGYYSTTDANHPMVNANLDLADLSFAKTYDGMNIVRMLAPIFSSLGGSYSGKLNMTAELDKNMEPIMKSIQAKGNLATDNVNIKEVKIIQELAKVIKQEDLVNRPMKDINLNFEVNDGRLKTQPFDFKIGDYNLTLSGTTGLDQTIEYSGKVKLPANVTKIEGFDTLGVLIGGTFTAPTFKIDSKSMAKEAGKVIENKAKDLIKDQLFKDNSDSTSSDKKDIKEGVEGALNSLFKKKKK